MEHGAVNPRIPDIGDGYLQPPYDDLPLSDMSYARAWARKVLRWRRDPMQYRKPPRFNPPSRRLKRGRTTVIPSLISLGIPPRTSPVLPLRLDLIPVENWRALTPATRRLLMDQEQALAHDLPLEHPARNHVIPPTLPPGSPPKRNPMRNKEFDGWHHHDT